jgi:hypothetical protein
MNGWRLRYLQPIFNLTKETMAKYTRVPRITFSKKDCTCSETGAKIKKREKCVVGPKTKKVYSMQSTFAQNINLT